MRTVLAVCVAGILSATSAIAAPSVVTIVFDSSEASW